MIWIKFEGKNDMGVKKIARPINRAKNIFVKWLKDNNAEDIEEFEGEKSDNWDYYRYINAFIGETLYSVSFEMWRGEVKIGYSDEENGYSNMCIFDFLQLINRNN